jgi:type VI protein secretion system component Hcp
MPIYLNLAGVRGESEAKDHQGWIELDTCSFGERTGDRSDHHSAEISCTRKADSTSVQLSQLSTIGTMQPATIDFVDLKGDKNLQLHFQDLSIADHRFPYAASGGPPVETFTLDYAKVSVARFSADVDPAAVSAKRWLLA